ncbi:Protein of unknown function [Pyronema omphalodes CBS 100304]|uniref:Uncharacterized protein n=1 Tax=Pyronema omphalodes (strain CBS 100304) TaxID=1076935 RepID=U4L4D9_PYROM|nr:Protein of unknown function [Pyronema omphalodes CBS 100304]
MYQLLDPSLLRHDFVGEISQQTKYYSVSAWTAKLQRECTTEPVGKEHISCTSLPPVSVSLRASPHHKHTTAYVYETRNKNSNKTTLRSHLIMGLDWKLHMY